MVLISWSWHASPRRALLKAEADEIICPGSQEGIMIQVPPTMLEVKLPSARFLWAVAFVAQAVPTQLSFASWFSHFNHSRGNTFISPDVTQMVHINL